VKVPQLAQSPDFLVVVAMEVALAKGRVRQAVKEGRRRGEDNGVGDEEEDPAIRASGGQPWLSCHEERRPLVPDR